HLEIELLVLNLVLPEILRRGRRAEATRNQAGDDDCAEDTKIGDGHSRRLLVQGARPQRSGVEQIWMSARSGRAAQYAAISRSISSCAARSARLRSAAETALIRGPPRYFATRFSSAIVRNSPPLNAAYGCCNGRSVGLNRRRCCS